MHSNRSTMVATFVIASVFLALVVGAAPAAAAGPTDVYDSIPAPLAPNYPSLGYQATQTVESGDDVSLGSGGRTLQEVTIGVSTWAREADVPSYSDPSAWTDPTGWSHPFTVNVYAVSGPVAAPVVGTLLATTTETKHIPWRHPDTTGCGPGKWSPISDEDTTSCFSGQALELTFDLSDPVVVLPSRIAVTLRFDTQSYGAAPLGASGPYDSFNLALPPAAPSTGADVSADTLLWDSTFGGRPAGLAFDTGWSGYVPAIRVRTGGATESTTVVTAADPHGWLFYDDQGTGGTLGSFTAGPATPPLGHGSARLVVSAATQGQALLQVPNSGGTRLDALTELSYSTYRSSVDAGDNLAIALQLNLDFDLTDANDSWQGRLVYEPYQTHGGAVIQGAWQSWDALAGRWWVSKPDAVSPAATCVQATPCTLAQFLAAYPDAGIHEDPLGGFVFKAGSGWASFEGNVDALRVGIDGVTTQYDFEDTPQCTTDCYVSPTGDDLNGGTSFADAKATIQAAVDTVQPGGTVHVADGDYAEDVLVNKAGVTLVGTGLPTMSGVPGGDIATLRISASDVTVDGFEITRQGNTLADWNDPALNSAGIAIQGQSITGALITGVTLTGNRTAIDINNSSGHAVVDSTITGNHTGMILRNTTDDLSVLRNRIADNRTVGVLFLDASGGTNSPLQQAHGSRFHRNDISGNWYGQVVDRQSGGSLPAPGGTNRKDFGGTWWGTTNPTISTANSAEPGYASLIPVEYGGTATPPAGPVAHVAGPASGNIDFTPVLVSSTDAGPGAMGSVTHLKVHTLGAQLGTEGRIQEGIDSTVANGLVDVAPGDYSETATGRTTPQVGPTYQFGLYVGTDRDGVTVRGVDDADAPITSSSAIVARITTNATNDFGSSGTFVYGSDVTFQGLEFGTNSPSSNKTFEVIGDGFSLLDSYINDAFGSVYLNDWTYDAGTQTSSIATFTIDGNRFAADNQVTIASGTGYGHPEDGRLITDNTFLGPSIGPAISFRGAAGPGGVPWYTYPVGGALIAGNTFGAADINIRATDTYAEGQFDWQAFRDDNTFTRLVWVEEGSTGDLRPFSYTSGAYAFTNARQLGGRIDERSAPNRPAGVQIAQAGDTIHVHSGTYPEQAIVDKADITVEGYGPTKPLVDDGGAATGNGFLITGDGVTLSNVKVQGYTTGVHLGGGSDSLLDGVSVVEVESVDNAAHGLFASAISGLSNLTIEGGTYSRNLVDGVTGGAGRGIAVWDGPKSDISIRDLTASQNGLVGIDINDGSVTGLIITGNTVTGNADSGIGVLGAKGPGTNLIADNTLTDNGRFGIEIKDPTGSGAASGAGSVVVSGNTVGLTSAANRDQDLAGIAVFRRAVGPLNEDQPSGAYVVGNTVTGYQNVGGGDGFGIVVEGTGHTVTQNVVSGNEVGVQAQAANPSNPSGDATATGTDWFDRGNAASYSGTILGNSITDNATAFRAVGLTGAADASGNWWGTTSESAVDAATVGDVDHTPYLHTGTDTSAPSAGFQGDFSTLDVVRSGAQVGSGPRIQEAIDMVTGSTVYVHEGEYIEDVLADVADLQLLGAHHGDAVGGRTFGDSTEATIVGRLTIQAQDVTVDGFSLTTSSTTGSVTGILVKTAGSGATIVRDIIEGVSTTGASGVAQAIYLEHGPDDVSITGNAISGISSERSAKGVYIGDSTATDPSSGVSITGNVISDVSSATRGAYGIQTNNAAGATLTISGNAISDLAGSWVHAIGIEGDAPDLSIDHNVIHDLTAAGVDRVAVFFEDDASYADAEVHRNSVDVGQTAFGVAIHPSLVVSTPIDATCNWWGSVSGPGAVAAGTGSLVGPSVDAIPWLTSSDLDGACDGIVETVAPTTPLSFDEGTAVANGGAFDDATATITADNGSFGTFTDNADGTWSWSLPANDPLNDGPASGTVTVTATTTLGATATTSFSYTVTNVAPSGTLGAPDEVAVGDTFDIGLTPTDPSAGDTFTYTFTCGAASPVTGSSASTTCAAPTSAQVGALIHVTGSVTDDDGGTSILYEDDVLVVPALTITPASYDFGFVQVGESSAPAAFTLTNHSDVAYDVDDVGFFVTATNHFRVVDTGSDECSGESLPAHGSCTFEVVFAPQTTGSKETTLGVELDGAQAPLPKAASLLSGTGIAPIASVTPDSLDFGDRDVSAGPSPAQTITVENTGDPGSTLTILGITRTGSPAFAESHGGLVPLGAGETFDIDVVFDPASPGDHDGNILVSTSAGDFSVTLSGTGTPTAVPGLSVTPSTHNFGDVTVGHSKSKAFSVSNTGTAGLTGLLVAVTGDDLSIVADDSTCDETTSLAVGADCTVSVRYQPDEVGDDTGDLTATADGGLTDSSSLVGSGVAGEAIVTVDPDAHEFDPVVVGGTPDTQDFTVRNTGDVTLTGLGVETTGAPAFSIVPSDGTDCETEAASLAPDATCVVRVQFAPGSGGAKTATLKVLSANAGNGTVNVPLSGTALAPELSISPSDHDFGDVTVDHSKSRTFTVANTGTAPLTGLDVQVTGDDLSIVADDSDCDDTSTLAVGESCEVKVRYRPDEVGDDTGSLDATADGGLSDSATLRGSGVPAKGVLTVSPDEGVFGPIEVGTTQVIDFTVQNTGDASLTFSNVSLTGSSTFAIEASPDTDCLTEDASLAPGDTCLIRVRFAPGGAGHKSGALKIRSDAANATVNVPLDGTATPHPAFVSVTPNPYDFGHVVFRGTKTRTFTVTNTGGSPVTVTSIERTGSSTFQVVDADDECAGETLGEDESCTFRVRFRAPSSTGGTKSGTIHVIGTGFDEILVHLTATAEPFQAKVDAFITDKSDKPSNYVGVGVYCTSSCSRQQAVENVRRGRTFVYRVRVRNDGNGVDSIRVRLYQTGSKASIRRIQVLRNGNQDVTSRVTNGSYVARDMNPGAEVYFWVKVTVRSDAVRGRVNYVQISGQSTRTSTVKDVVRAKTRVR